MLEGRVRDKILRHKPRAIFSSNENMKPIGYTYGTCHPFVLAMLKNRGLNGLTMETVTVKITEGSARKLLAEAEVERSKLRVALSAKEAEIMELQRAVGGVDSQVPRNPKTGRAPKGQSEKAILAFFEEHKGSGWTQTEVAKRTGVSMATTGRVLEKLSKAGKLDGGNGTWGIP